MESTGINENDIHQIEKLQQEMTVKVDSMHRIIYGGPEEELRQDTLRNAHLSEELFQLYDMYRKIPEGYHLDMQITPEAYYRLGGGNNLWLRREKNQGDIDYRLRIARFVESRQDMDPNLTLLNIALLSEPAQLPRFGLQEITKSLIRTGEVVRPQEILNMNIKQNPSKNK